MTKHQVIIVTDGDRKARKTVEWAARQIGGRCISMSAGNPTPIDGKKIVELVKQTPHGPVLIMVDDKGYRQAGPGEEALEAIVRHPDIEVLGVLAVASNTHYTQGIRVDFSVNKFGELVEGPVDKLGLQELPDHKYLEGDTVDILNKIDVPIVIGIGDIGKMDKADDLGKGSPITLMAIKEIMKQSGYNTNLE